MEYGRMEWSEVVSNSIPLFGFAKNEWNEIKHNGIHSIKSFNFPIPPNLGCMQWNGTSLLKYYQFTLILILSL